jgi:chromosome partitioning protein
MKILSCYSIKGGVGKTALAVNLAYQLATRGFRTLLVDLDPQGAAGFYLRVAPARDFPIEELKSLTGTWVRANLRESDFPGLHILPSSLAYRHLDNRLSGMKKSRKQLQWMLEEIEDGYDVAVLDCPPNITLLSENIFRASRAVLVPVIPTPLSSRTLDQLCGFFGDEDLDTTKIQPFFSMVQSRKGLHRSEMESLRSSHPFFYRACIPFSVDVEAMGARRAPLTSYSQGAAARAFVELSTEIIDRNPLR